MFAAFPYPVSLISTFCSSLGSTSLNYRKATIDPLDLWVIRNHLLAQLTGKATQLNLLTSLPSLGNVSRHTGWLMRTTTRKILYVMRQCVKTHMPTHGDYNSKRSLYDSVMCQDTHFDSWGLQFETSLYFIRQYSNIYMSTHGDYNSKISFYDLVKYKDIHTSS